MGGTIQRDIEATGENISQTLLRELLFTKLLDITSDGYIAIDPSGRIIEINGSYCELLGVTYEEALTKNILELIPETKLLEVMEKNSTDVDVLDIHEAGVLKGIPLVCSRASVRHKGKPLAAFAQVRYSDKAAKVAGSFQQVERELEYYKQEYKRLIGESYRFDRIITASASMQDLKKRALRAAGLDFTILLQGETGTGKEVFAHGIHNASNRSGMPFIRVNCAAIPAELIESELFGYEEGAFSGAKKGGKPGKFELADKGTLFLDEIGDMPMPMQAKLLRVLQEQELERLGSNELKSINVRVIAATNQNLETLIAQNRFRADLYYRLNVINLSIPPLREREDDVLHLAEHYLHEMNVQYGTGKRLGPKVRELLGEYPWPGNVRELRNTILHAYSFSDSSEIGVESLPEYIHMQKHIKTPVVTNRQSLADVIRQVEADIISETLLKYGGNYELAASDLGIHKTTLYKKLRIKNKK